MLDTEERPELSQGVGAGLLVDQDEVRPHVAVVESGPLAAQRVVAQALSDRCLSPTV